MLAQDAKPANDTPPVTQSRGWYCRLITVLSLALDKSDCVPAAGKSTGHGRAQSPAEDTSSSGGYAAPSMPVESVDMFSGLDLTGFVAAAEPVAASVPGVQKGAQPSPQPLVQPVVQHRC